MDPRTWNVLQVAIGSMLVFSGFRPELMVQETILESVSENDTSIDKDAGYYSSAIMFGLATVAYLLAPPIVIALGAKWSMTIGGLTYLIFMASFFYIKTWLLYLTSAILGFGAVLFWTGQGNYLAMNSDANTASRNSGVLWAIFQLCSIVGGLCVFFIFKFTIKAGAAIEMSTIRYLYAAFTIFCVLGVITFLLLRRPPNSNSNEKKPLQPSKGHLANLMSTFKMIFTRDMSLLCLVFLYTGIEQAFCQGIYSSCLSFTEKFDSIGKVILAYNALCFGLGQIVGGGTFGIFGKKFDKYGRTPIIVFACAAHLICFALIFINLPTESPMGKTNATSLIEPSLALALVCSFLLGLADSCWNTQIYSILSTIYSEQSAQGFAIYKFCNAAMVSVSFFCYGKFLQLRIQLLIMAVCAVIAVVCFYAVERNAKKNTETASFSSESEAETERIDSISIISISKSKEFEY